ncbi:ras-related protein Rap-2b-like [Zeugodacus cucurbitae]|uniref:ras-related protein Rap-2b-like n=1 Tax=Zeugodacus cucurbitae TaxID=28588 RepID=UPI00059693DF|nr:ras-related protein Rap-2b-like [Zeugodacus cucurbitae]XP_028902081.1 ras-related protein Rap-2b-like [Zeugodacus cucurbitae]XP_054088943.1 ras-related protein Rap-2b-like [Zeugodacus cucurbitae]XP_054088944.1 ras-related protein Rap-2b-like [Zeugodacus cucurbitae]
MPGSCQRLRLPSLATVMRTTRASTTDYTATTIRKEQRRVVMMGAARVGKTCIVSQFLYDKYQARYKQTVEELHRGEYELPDGSALTLDILDTSGSYEFPAMRTLSISTAGAFILVYAVDDKQSWLEVERLRKQIIAKRGLKVPIVIVGNKVDINEADRQVEHEVTEMIVCEDWKCGYVECSAKDNMGIVEIFKELLVQANIRYNLSPAVRRRRQSLPSYSCAAAGMTRATKSPSHKYTLKRHSCTMT